VPHVCPSLADMGFNRKNPGCPTLVDLFCRQGGSVDGCPTLVDPILKRQGGFRRNQKNCQGPRPKTKVMTPDFTPLTRQNTPEKLAWLDVRFGILNL